MAAPQEASLLPSPRAAPTNYTVRPTSGIVKATGQRYNNYTALTTVVGGVNVTSHVKPEDLRKIYGFTVGGALIKDKLFWIYTYDQHSRVFPVVGVPVSPTNFYNLPLTTLPTGANCNLTPTTPEAAGNGYLSGDSIIYRNRRQRSLHLGRSPGDQLRYGRC